MAGGGAGNSEYDVNLNLAPVVDCMIVLITFLLLGASLTSIVLMDSTIPSVVLEARAKSIQEKDVFRLKLDIQSNQLMLALEEKGKNPKTWTVPRSKETGKYDYPTLHKMLVKIKEQNPDRFAIDFRLIAEIPYGEVIELMETTKHLTKDDPEISLLDKKTEETVKLTQLFPDVQWTGLAE